MHKESLGETSLCKDFYSMKLANLVKNWTLNLTLDRHASLITKAIVKRPIGCQTSTKDCREEIASDKTFLPTLLRRV